MRLIERRIGLLFALFVVLIVAAIGRAAWLGTVEAGSLRERAAGQQSEQLVVPARRGTISDRNGVELAVSEDAVAVVGNPMLIKRPRRTAARLAPIIGRRRREVERELADRSRGFVYLARQLPASRGERVRKLEIEGLDTLGEQRRLYPRGKLASQLIGAVGTENFGLAGIEQSQEQRLRGSDGKRRVVKDARGDTVSLVDAKRARPGADLRLTVDSPLQQQVETVLQDVGDKYEPRGATAIALDPRSGSVLALANWPPVDPQRFGEASGYARQNRAVADSYEPGSTFKPFTISGALEERVATPDTPWTIGPTIQVADRTIKNAEEGGGGTLTTSEILKQSSNVGTVTIGLRLGKLRFDRWVRRFGFGKGTDADIPGEAAGIVPRPAEYSGSSMGNLPIGQGLAVTPMQMISAYGAIANGGVMRRPHVLAGTSARARRVIDPETAGRVTKMLEGVTTEGGTGTNARVPGYSIAGKTGTAQKPDGRGGYSESKYVASFIGYPAARRPRIVIAVVVDEPKGAIFGGDVAAPAFEQIASFAFPYLRIPPR